MGRLVIISIMAFMFGLTTLMAIETGDAIPSICALVFFGLTLVSVMKMAHEENLTGF